MRRGLAFAALAAACALGAGGYILRAAQRNDAVARAAGPPPTVGGPRVVFRSLDRKGSYGLVAVAPLSAPARRELTGLRCDRIYFAGRRGLCLARRGSFGLAYEARVFDSQFEVVSKVRLAGVPSRARVSADGRYGAATTFVAGHSYAAAGTFSTQTVLIDLARGRLLADLEDFAVYRDGRRIRARDFNFWGVTFGRADSNRFYATLATGGKTYLVAGNVRARRLRTLRTNVECPSLSPDGTRIAYKKLVGGPPAIWRLHVLDLRTGADVATAETRPIDDQAEWLDDGRVLYRMGEETWVVRADGTGAPRRFLARAESPAIVRSG